MTQKIGNSGEEQSGGTMLMAAHNPADKGVGEGPIYHQKTLQELRKTGARGEKNGWAAVQECK